MTAGYGMSGGELRASQQDHTIRMCAAKNEIPLQRFRTDCRLPRG